MSSNFRFLPLAIFFRIQICDFMFTCMFSLTLILSSGRILIQKDASFFSQWEFWLLVSCLWQLASCILMRWEVFLRWGNLYTDIPLLLQWCVLFLQSLFWLICVPVQHAASCSIWLTSYLLIVTAVFLQKLCPFLCCIFLELISRAPGCFQPQAGAALVWLTSKSQRKEILMAAAEL